MTSQEGSRETGHAPLTSVESIPNVIHHCVQGVIEASLGVLEEDRLDRAIPSVGIEALEHHQANVVEFANVDLLPFEMSASRVSSTDLSIVRHNHEVCWSFTGLGGSQELGALEAKDEIVRSSAREVAAVLDVSPLSWRLVEESPSGFVNICEYGVIEVVRWDLVRAVRVTLEDNRGLTAHRLANEVGEVATVASKLATPVTFTM